MSDDVRETNRAHWDALAAVHGQDGYYDAEALIGGGGLPGRPRGRGGAARRWGRSPGLDVLHLQCHIGFDSISLARRGARVTGADFSPASLSPPRVGVFHSCSLRARELAGAGRGGGRVRGGRRDGAAGRAARALRPRATRRSASPVLGSRTSRGRGCAPCTIARWRRPGGRLVLVEIHPLFNMIGEREPLPLDMPYAADGPRRFEEPGSYADQRRRSAVAVRSHVRHIVYCRAHSARRWPRSTRCRPARRRAARARDTGRDLRGERAARRPWTLLRPDVPRFQSVLRRRSGGARTLPVARLTLLAASRLGADVTPGPVRAARGELATRSISRQCAA